MKRTTTLPFLGDVIICNEPASLPVQPVLPVAIPELYNLMIIPLRYGGDFVGYIGLANRPDGFDTPTSHPSSSLSLQRAQASCMLLKTSNAKMSWQGKSISPNAACVNCSNLSVGLRLRYSLMERSLIVMNALPPWLACRPRRLSVKTVRHVHPPDKHGALRAICDAVVDSGIPASSVEAPLITADGSIRIIAWTSPPCAAPPGCQRVSRS
jgi:hypothetical protein